MRYTKFVAAFLGLAALLAATGCAKLQARDNLNKGVQAFKDTHYEKSVDYFKKAIELDPDLTNAELYLATAYAQQFVPGGRGEDNDKNAKLRFKRLKTSSNEIPVTSAPSPAWQAFTRT